MSVIDTLITDRASGAKYNYTDLNRVEQAFEYLQTKLNGDYGFNLSLTTKTDWTRNDLGQLGAVALMETYRQNVVDIRATITQQPNTPQTPDSMRFLTYQEANDIEQTLADTEELLNKMPSAFRYSGQGGLI